MKRPTIEALVFPTSEDAQEASVIEATIEKVSNYVSSMDAYCSKLEKKNKKLKRTLKAIKMASLIVKATEDIYDAMAPSFNKEPRKSFKERIDEAMKKDKP